MFRFVVANPVTSSLVICGYALLITSNAVAQVDRASLTGTIKDAADRAIPGATVTATQLATGIERTTLISSSGTYNLPELSIGRYRVTYAAPGFQQKVIDSVEESVGHTRTLDVALSVAGAEVHIEVSDIGEQFDKSSDTLGARIESEQAKQLPLNGRNWSTLTALVPGAVDTGGSNQRSIRFAGRGLDDNNFTYDGIDTTNIVNQAQQPFVRLAIPTEAIEEFRIDTMLFTAEDGSTPGGQVAVASRAGANSLHGGLFEYVRNDLFDAHEPTDPAGTRKNPFRLNQFGGSIGGPILHDRTFYFFTYEGLRQTLGQTLGGLVPSDMFRVVVAAANPALVPILNAYPHGTSPLGATSAVANFVGSGRQLDHEDSVVLRLDHRFSLADSIYLRFNFDASYSDAPLIQGKTYLNDKQLITS